MQPAERPPVRSPGKGKHMYELRNARTGIRLTRCKNYSEIEKDIEVIQAVEGLNRKDIDVVYIDAYDEAQASMLKMVRKFAESKEDPKVAVVKIRAGCDMLAIEWVLETVQRLTLTIDALDQYIRRRIAP